jgi:hypothetical protein
MESLDSLNQQLADIYGIDTLNGLPMWRIVRAGEQYEERMSKFSENGVEYLQPQKVEIKKYKYIEPDKYVLENLVLIPFHNQYELCGRKFGYEPIWTFEHQLTGKALPPRIDVCHVVIDFIQIAKGKPFNGAKYKEDPEARAKELAEMELYLYGNETDVNTSLAHGEAIVVPSGYNKEN